MMSAKSIATVCFNKVSISAIALFSLSGPMPTAAQGLPEPLDNVPMEKIVELESTDWIAVGHGNYQSSTGGIEGAGAGTMTLSGLAGEVTLALAYWEGIDFYAGANGLYDSAEIVLDGVPVAGEVMYAGGDNHCWDASPNMINTHSAVSYRADVTEIVRARGNGDYAFSGLESGPGDYARGISLIVYYDDGDPDNDARVAHYEGKQSNSFVQDGVPRRMTFDFEHDYIGGEVTMVLHVSDGQSELTDAQNVFTTWPGQAGQATYWQNLGYPNRPNGPWVGGRIEDGVFGNRSLWDIDRFAVGNSYRNGLGSYTHKFEQYAGGDCVTLHVAQVVSAATPKPLPLSPASFDFGELPVGQMRVQRFTFTNPFSSAVSFSDGSVTYAANSPSITAIVAETCSGRSIAPGETCTIDVRFGRMSGAASGRSSYFMNVRTTHPTFGNKTYAATVWGSISAGSPPSSGAIEPPYCRFPDTPRNTVSDPIRFTVRNRGDAAVEATGFELTRLTYTTAQRFAIVGSDCPQSGTFPAGASCYVDIEFRPANGNAGNTYSDLLTFSHDTADGGDAWFAQVVGRVASSLARPEPSGHGGDHVFGDSFEGEDVPPEPTGCI